MESDKIRQIIVQLMISVLAEEELIQQIENYVCPKFEVTGFFFLISNFFILKIQQPT